MRRGLIPEHVRKEADAVIRDFVEKVIRDPTRYYVARHKGGYLYLDRLGYGAPYHVARLTYDSGTGSWGFAIFKYSNELGDLEPEAMIHVLWEQASTLRRPSRECGN